MRGRLRVEKAELIVDNARIDKDGVVNPQFFKGNAFDRVDFARALTFQTDRQVDRAMLKIEQERASEIFGATGRIVGFVWVVVVITAQLNDAAGTGRTGD